jgi:hypothetical protein
MKRNTHSKDIDGNDIYENDIVGIYTAAVLALSNNAELQQKAAGKYKVVYKFNGFILEEIEPNWFHKPYYTPISEFNVLKIIN